MTFKYNPLEISYKLIKGIHKYNYYNLPEHNNINIHRITSYILGAYPRYEMVFRLDKNYAGVIFDFLNTGDKPYTIYYESLKKEGASRVMYLEPPFIFSVDHISAMVKFITEYEITEQIKPSIAN